MKHLFLLLAFLPFFLSAQEDAKYLEGAVPVENGKVVFTKEIQIPSLSQNEVYETALKWAEERFNNEDCRVVYQNRDKGEMAATGKEYIIFSSTALSLDRSKMSYQVLIYCQDQLCTIKLTNIRYDYDVAYQREPEKYIAEEWITDENSIRKGKLNRISGKFRRKTIDFADELLIFQPAEHEGVFRKGGQPRRFVSDDAQVLPLFLFGEAAFQEQVGKAVDGRHGRLEFVGKVVNEVVLERPNAVELRAHLVEVFEEGSELTAARHFELMPELPVRDFFERFGKLCRHLIRLVVEVDDDDGDDDRDGRHDGDGRDEGEPVILVAEKEADDRERHLREHDERHKDEQEHHEGVTYVLALDFRRKILLFSVLSLVGGSLFLSVRAHFLITALYPMPRRVTISNSG